MPYLVLPALVPDIPSIYDVYFTAFAGTPLTSALFPTATEEDLVTPTSEFRQGHTSHTQHYWDHSTTQYTLKCIDSDTGDIVGMALWDIYPTPSNWVRGTIDWLEGDQRRKAERLITPLWDAREKLWTHQRYVYCHVIAVHPQHQRRGIGRMLAEFGLNTAKQAGLPIYLESSKEGVDLYRQLGFRQLNETVVHGKEDLGVEEDHEVPLMVWVPEGQEEKLPEPVKDSLVKTG